MDNTIGKTYVTIEMADALKNLGYYQDGLNCFNSSNCVGDGVLYMDSTRYTPEEIKERYFNLDYVVLKPTIDEAIEWIRVNLNIWIQVDLNTKMDRYSIHFFNTKPEGKYCCTIDREVGSPSYGWDSPIKAKLKALESLLVSKLIKYGNTKEEL